MRSKPGLVAVMPALDEEGSIAAVITELYRRGVELVIVGDNGSRDTTAQVAAKAGATVVDAPQRGYGNACLAALAQLPPDCQAVVFCDADGADDLSRLDEIVDPVLEGTADVIIGSRTLGGAEAGALSLPQRVGNRVATWCMRLLYRVRVTDLGPFRCVDRAALNRLAMSDPTFGWTTELQVKAYRLGLRIGEVPVTARVRTAGRSKIGGRLLPGLQAGWIILRTIWRYHRCALPAVPDGRREGERA